MGQNTVTSVIGFSSYIADRTRGFTGREKVFEAINSWLTKPKRLRSFILTGEPGSPILSLAVLMIWLVRMGILETNH
jgi:hypothetical protein